MKNKKVARRLKIRKRIRRTVHGTTEIPRLSLYKSNKGIYAQIINDDQGHTLVSASSLALKLTTSNIQTAKKVGAVLAEKALAQGIHTIVFDRSGYIYHGRVKALAEGTREKGLKF